MKKIQFLFCLSLVVLNAKAQLTVALPDDAWNESEWISVVDAPVVTGRVSEPTRAADGANWVER